MNSPNHTTLPGLNEEQGDRRVCPIISAVSELKQFSEYPKCNPDCAWFDDQWSRCGLLSVSRSIDELQREMSSTLTHTSPLAGLDWNTKQDIVNGLRGINSLLEHLANKL